MPAPDLTDDELDLRLRAAAAALAGLAPAGRVDELALRVEAELAQIDLSPVSPQPAVSKPLESRMTSDTDEKSGPANVTPPSGRTEDSGLHDIKALAQDTRRRISRRITSQHDIDPDLLASSTGSMRMIALPEPAMVVALPEAPASMEAVREAMKDPAMAAAAAAVPIQRKRPTLWIGLGAAAVAAAAAAVIIAGGGGGDGDKKSTTQVAANEAAARQSVESVRVSAPAMGSGSAMVAAVTPDTASGAAAGVPESDPATAPAVTGAGSVAIAPPPAAGSAAGGSARTVDGGKGVDKTPRGGSADVKPAGGSAAKPGGDSKAAGGGSAKPAGGAVATGAGGGGGPKGEKSIEDLLNDASGGSSKPKDTGGGGGGGGGDTAPTGPTKTSLEPKEIKAGMSAVAGAAQSCFGKHGVAGHVKVKATVTSSGSVSKVDATGEFAGTPTGACVAGAVKGASFPSWTGAPMTVTYSFTLQE